MAKTQTNVVIIDRYEYDSLMGELRTLREARSRPKSAVEIDPADVIDAIKADAELGRLVRAMQTACGADAFQLITYDGKWKAGIHGKSDSKEMFQSPEEALRAVKWAGEYEASNQNPPMGKSPLAEVIEAERDRLTELGRLVEVMGRCDLVHRPPYWWVVVPGLTDKEFPQADTAAEALKNAGMKIESK